MSAEPETLRYPDQSHDESPDLLPATSIVIEWENVVLAGNTRAERMLAELGRQLRELGGRFADDPEVLLLYDPDEVEEADVERATGDNLAWREGDPFALTLVASPGHSYYEQKNRGAELAGGELLVFLDSDVIPESGWLENLLAPFEDERVNVVAGHTHLDAETLYQRAGKYFWFFPSREEGRRDGFMANNVAFRRELFLDYGFPQHEAYRYQCVALGQQLVADGIGIYQQTDARCSHPAPNGLRHFLGRGLMAGHDKGVRHEGSLGTGVLAALWRYVATLVVMFRRIVRRGRLSRTPEEGPEVFLAAVLVGTLYYTLALVGEIVSLVNPGVVERLL